MRKIICILMAAMTVVSCSKIKADGPIVTRDYEISSSIHTIDVGYAMKLELSDDVAPGELKIETNDNIFEYIRVYTSSKKVEITLKNERYKGNIDITVYASAAQYSSVSASGASDVYLLSPIASSTYDIVLSGASKFIMTDGSSHLSSMSVDASGSSKATLLGSAAQCNVKASGSSSINCKKFTCVDLEVRLSGSSDMIINITGKATGDLSGSSTLNYSGGANINVSTSGSSKINNI